MEEYYIPNVHTLVPRDDPSSREFKIKNVASRPGYNTGSRLIWRSIKDMEEFYIPDLEKVYKYTHKTVDRFCMWAEALAFEISDEREMDLIAIAKTIMIEMSKQKHGQDICSIHETLETLMLALVEQCHRDLADEGRTGEPLTNISWRDRDKILKHKRTYTRTSLFSFERRVDYLQKTIEYHRTFSDKLIKAQEHLIVRRKKLSDAERALKTLHAHTHVNVAEENTPGSTSAHPPHTSWDKHDHRRSSMTEDTVWSEISKITPIKEEQYGSHMSFETEDDGESYSKCEILNVESIKLNMIPNSDAKNWTYARNASESNSMTDILNKKHRRGLALTTQKQIETETVTDNIVKAANSSENKAEDGIPPEKIYQKANANNHIINNCTEPSAIDKRNPCTKLPSNTQDTEDPKGENYQSILAGSIVTVKEEVKATVGDEGNAISPAATEMKYSALGSTGCEENSNHNHGSSTENGVGNRAVTFDEGELNSRIDRYKESLQIAMIAYKKMLRKVITARDTLQFVYDDLMMDMRFHILHRMKHSLECLHQVICEIIPGPKQAKYKAMIDNGLNIDLVTDSLIRYEAQKYIFPKLKDFLDNFPANSLLPHGRIVNKKVPTSMQSLQALDVEAVNQGSLPGNKVSVHKIAHEETGCSLNSAGSEEFIEFMLKETGVLSDIHVEQVTDDDLIHEHSKIHNLKVTKWSSINENHADPLTEVKDNSEDGLKDIQEHMVQKMCLITTSNHSKRPCAGFLKVKTSGTRIKVKVTSEESDLCFGWFRRFKFGPKSWGFFYKNDPVFGTNIVN